MFRVIGPPWIEVLAQAPLEPASRNLFAIADDRSWSHVRLNIFPDGGVARLRVYGNAAVDWPRLRRERRPVDLASIRNGGLVLGASDMHFGAKDNLIMPGRALNMGDGWETRRRRGEGFDWMVVRLGTTGSVAKVEIDTNHFKGNYPESASVEACLAPGAPLEALHSTATVWREPSTAHAAAPRIASMSTRRSSSTWDRCRTSASTSFRTAASAGSAFMDMWLRIDRGTETDARALLSASCGATRWVARMLARRPFGSREALLDAARDEWFALSPDDWREAFLHHPAIGDVGALRERFPATHQLSASEQAGVAAASEDTLNRLADGNRRYRERFGYTSSSAQPEKTPARCCECSTNASATIPRWKLASPRKNTPGSRPCA